MRIRTILPILAVSAAAACGWSPGAELETRTFRLEHMNPEEAVRLIDPYVRSQGSGVSQGGSRIAAITVREMPDALDRIAAMLAEFDHPRPSVTLHFQVIEANGFETSDPAIADVEAALRDLFRFRGYRLAAEGVVVGTAESPLRQQLAGAERMFAIAAYVHSVPAQDGAGVIQLEVELTGDGVSLATTVGVPVGQTMVIGTAPQNARRGEAGALILTVRPELGGRGRT